MRHSRSFEITRVNKEFVKHYFKFFRPLCQYLMFFKKIKVVSTSPLRKSTADK